MLGSRLIDVVLGQADEGYGVHINDHAGGHQADTYLYYTCADTRTHLVLVFI